MSDWHQNRRPPAERFHDRYVVEPDGCWQWTGSFMPNGYGRLIVKRHTVLAHRFAYELLVGPIPAGLQIDHLCRNRACVNPAHLEPVTIKQNLLRSPITNAARNAAKTRCLHGHEFTAANTYAYRGQRHC